MKIGIFGAGQAGVMVSRWVPSCDSVLCFIDNNEKKQGQVVAGLPVCSLSEALARNLDVIWVAVLNKEASAQILQQIREDGFTGELIDIQEYRRKQDIRAAALRLVAEEIKARNIEGEMAELGVFQGAFAEEMNRLLPEKDLYLFDTFCGFDERDVEIEKKFGSRNAKQGLFSDTSVSLVRDRLPHPEKVTFCVGYFPDSLPPRLPKMALVSLDPDLYEPVYQGLKVFYPLLVSGGIILIHDYNSMQFPGVQKAVRKFCEEEKVYVVPLMDLHGSAVLIKQG